MKKIGLIEEIAFLVARDGFQGLDLAVTHCGFEENRELVRKLMEVVLHLLVDKEDRFIESYIKRTKEILIKEKKEDNSLGESFSHAINIIFSFINFFEDVLSNFLKNDEDATRYWKIIQTTQNDIISFHRSDITRENILAAINYIINTIKNFITRYEESIYFPSSY